VIMTVAWASVVSPDRRYLDRSMVALELAAESRRAARIDAEAMIRTGAEPAHSTAEPCVLDRWPTWL